MPTRSIPEGATMPFHNIGTAICNFDAQGRRHGTFCPACSRIPSQAHSSYHPGLAVSRANAGATVTVADVIQSNGVIHVIGAVLMP